MWGILWVGLSFDLMEVTDLSGLSASSNINVNVGAC